ncbi:MAG: oxidoreductase [Tepidiformaceae bacterium]
MTFRAFVVDKTADNFTARLTDMDESKLPAGDVTIRVAWSSVNYKDGLACIPDGRVVRSYPMVPGVDLSGIVSAAGDSRFAVGDRVMVTGFDVGTAHWGGFAEIARVSGDWVQPIPKGLSMKEAMAIGTAGLTSALSLEALERNGLNPSDGPVIVTGATGGVGSTAVSMFAQVGYTVAASTGKAAEHQFLRDLGATEILSREDVSAESTRPMDAERWAGAVDPVGGATTAYLVRSMKYGASIALSGVTGGGPVSTTVYPFILRGVNLLGIESVYCPMERRLAAWARLGTDLKPARLLDSIAVEVTLDDILPVARKILTGEVRGRTLVRVSGEA